jgi:benzoyl-CoA reductase/2-hydroxyglutaryl-CoA dehydratase subunit BcrC/BadD/HgdB
MRKTAAPKTAAEPPGLSDQTLRESLLCLESLRKAGAVPKEAEYFLSLCSRYFDSAWIQKQTPKIIILGTSIPAEIVSAFDGTHPFWVIGGSRAAAESADSLVPRDTDPVTRSMFGYLLSAPHMAQDALVIVPITSDSQRKLAFLLKRKGWNVTTVDIPPENGLISERRCIAQMERLAEVISAHLKKRFTRQTLFRSALRIEKIRQTIRNFNSAALKNGDILRSPLRMLICNSFYMADDLEEWRLHLIQITEGLSQNISPGSYTPSVLIVGSPIYFPNYKIPFLLLESGIDICGTIDPAVWKMQTPADTVPKNVMAHFAKAQLEDDCSGAYIYNDALWKAAEATIKATHPDGVIWHILKGQIEYDFELLRLEKRFEEFSLPVFRLETDYQYQDVEQLRIRIEAFGELFTQRGAVMRDGVL